MTRAEAAELLPILAAYDRRTVGDADVIAWSEALSDVRYADALAAVHGHYRVSSEWLDPARVRRLVAALRGARLERVPVPPPPADIADDPAQALDWQRRWTKAIADGTVTEDDARSGEVKARDMSFLGSAFRRVPALRAGQR